MRHVEAGRRSRRSLVLSGALCFFGACVYSDPALPTDASPASAAETQMARSGVDRRHEETGSEMRSSSGTEDNTEENAYMGYAKAQGTGGSLLPSVWAWGSELPIPVSRTGGETPEEVAPQKESVDGVFMPSDHYVANGQDLGPSLDALPGTGGPNGHRRL